MDITMLPSVPGSRHRRKRVGRGVGSGHGKTSTRGQKGQRARTGSRKRPGFEGGQNPLIRRFPKRGFKRKATGHQTLHEIINVKQLNVFKAGQHVTPEVLKDAGLIKDAQHQIKVLGDGDLKKQLTIAVHQVSEGAKTKITEAGGSVELVVQKARRAKDKTPA